MKKEDLRPRKAGVEPKPVLYSAVDEHGTVRMALAPFDDGGVVNETRVVLYSRHFGVWLVSFLGRDHSEKAPQFADDGEAIGWLLGPYWLSQQEGV